MKSIPLVSGEFALLKVISLSPVGTFLQWQQTKDILLPFSEQTDELFIDDLVLVFTYLDKSERPCASMRIENFLNKTSAEFKEQQEVDLWIYRKTDLGFKAIIDGMTMGILYENEVFQPLKYGQKLKGYIGKIRTDGKVDLTLNRVGHKSAENIAPIILKMLTEQNGFLTLNEKTTPKTILYFFLLTPKSL